MYWFIYNNSTGVIRLFVQSDVETWNGTLDGESALGIKDTDTTAQEAITNLSEYTVQNGQLVHSNPPTIAQQLASAQQEKIAEITAGLNTTLAGGFKSNTTSHTYITTTNGQSNMEGDLKRFELDATLTSVQFYTVDAGWIAHTPSQLQSAFLDGGKWKDAQYAQAQNLVGQVKSAVTIDAVNAVPAFTEATY